MAELKKEHIIPVHIAAIMDGNGRWAQKRGLPRTAGNSAGSETFRKISEYLNSIGVKYFTVYAFSTENWKRPAAEVSAIMKLLEKYLHEAIESMAEKNIRLRVWGDLSRLSPALVDLIKKTDKLSDGLNGLQVNVCLNYGGRADILRAVKAAAEDYKNSSFEINEETFSKYLYSFDTPDPELIIRTGGEQRISNFLLWQNAYSEFYFTDILWPDMDESAINEAIIEYNRRNRRFGGV